MKNLKNGTQELGSFVTVTMFTLKLLLDENPIAFYDAAMIARDSSHVPYGNNASLLCDLMLIDSIGGMHDSIKNVILSAVTDVGNVSNMKLVSPYL